MNSSSVKDSTICKQFEAPHLFSVTKENFDQAALSLFRWQAEYVLVYKRYLNYLKVQAKDIHTIQDIPYLPITFFKSQTVLANSFTPEVIYKSSGTGGNRSQHLVANTAHYLTNSRAIFEQQYSSLKGFHVLALLPSYLEQGDSSLVAMVSDFINESQPAARNGGSSLSGFFLDDWSKLSRALAEAKQTDRKTLFIGVTYALLDFAESHPQDLSHCIIMETGGMKGRKKEMTRTEVHRQLCAAFQSTEIHSEYGMTELLSQAYAKKGGLFSTPPWMKATTRQLNDPFQAQLNGRQGVLQFIDLANYASCAFIETQDMGIVYDSGDFEVIGRMDNSESRGCSLMYTDKKMSN
ncbi:MAG: acyl transferase [Cyclobacteriaceae bacterium]